MVNKNRLGLFFASVYTVWYLSWVLLVVFGWAQPMLDGLFSAHFLSITYSLLPLTLPQTTLGILLCVVGGYIDGFIIGLLWNTIVGKKRNAK